MKVSAYYRSFIGRQSFVRDMFLGFFYEICSWPRLLLEVFLRRKMGERYFSLTNALFIFAALCAWPFYSRTYHFWGSYGLWFAFASAFLGMSFYRKRELRRRQHLFDFSRFSLSAGEPWPQLRQVVFQGQLVRFSPRQLTTLVEPAVAVLPGALLWWGLHQPLGVLLMGCGVNYSLSYVATYQHGTDFLLNEIDKVICQQDLGVTMAAGLAPDFSRGASFPGDLPTDPAQRQQLASAFLDEETAYPIR